jgi:hypothetical protein
MSDDVTAISTLKPGYKTTEWYLSSLAALVGIALSSGAIGDMTALGRGLALLATALTVAGYSVSRGLAKKGS